MLDHESFYSRLLAAKNAVDTRRASTLLGKLGLTPPRLFPKDMKPENGLVTYQLMENPMAPVVRFSYISQNGGVMCYADLSSPDGRQLYARDIEKYLQEVLDSI